MYHSRIKQTRLSKKKKTTHLKTKNKNKNKKRKSLTNFAPPARYTYDWPMIDEYSHTIINSGLLIFWCVHVYINR